jgi:phenylalanyl-tRNA synthetase beta chain
LLARVTVNGQPAGAIGQLTPGKVRQLELRGEVVVVAELELSVLQAVAGSARKFGALPRFPSVTRDLAVVVDRTVAHGRIGAALHGANEPLLADVALFDVFTDDRGEKIAAERKSLAYSLTYRAEDRTLRADEVNAAHARLKAALQAAVSDVQFRE